MFDDLDNNYKLLFSAYKKLKSYYYYNKNFLFMRKKIAEFEDDSDYMEEKLHLLSRILQNPDAFQNDIDRWINEIDYYVMPKGFIEENKLNEKYVTNAISINKAINKVNFFANLPIELHLLETVWTLMVGKIIYDKTAILDCSYGNALNYHVVYNGEECLDRTVNYGKTQMFKMYYYQYCTWKNNAIDAIDRNTKNKNIVLISLDVKGFYYSIKWKFDILNNYVNTVDLESIALLTSVLEKIYKKYTGILSELRPLDQDLINKEYVLPIGMFSSMLLANLYLSSFDKNIISQMGVLYYGRYVDDLLIAVEVERGQYDCSDESFSKLCSRSYHILDTTDNAHYSLFGYPELKIQKEKIKALYFEKGKDASLLKQLKKTRLYPSGMNIIPSDDTKIRDFDEEAYLINDLESETKIRDFGHLEISRFNLGRHMAELARSSKNNTNDMPNETKVLRTDEIEKVKRFFQGSNAIEFSNNWINALYFLMYGGSYLSKSTWKSFEKNVRSAIKNLKVSKVEDIKTNKVASIKSKLKIQLLNQFDISVATALALYPDYYKKEQKAIRALACKIRHANMFNHYLVSYPFTNYSDTLNDEIDLTHISENALTELDADVLTSRKMRLSPRFIQLDELLIYDFYECARNDRKWLMSESRLKATRERFFEINHVLAEYNKAMQVEISEEECLDKKYILDVIKIDRRAYELNRVKVAVANLKLETKDCLKGLKRTNAFRDRTKFVEMLDEAYNCKADFIVFPEFYMPLDWMRDVLEYVKKTGITIITGMQYIITGPNRAHNTMAVFSQITSGKYKNGCFFIREKNDYAPAEKRLLTLKEHTFVENKQPRYLLIESGGLRYGTFLCYEFTDLMARALYKNRVDLLFISENNRDTSYFSNIIESTTRDLYALLVQANTSIYGDSRITGPYIKEQRNIVQIKGGENDDILIGEVDIKSVKKKYKEKLTKLYDDLNDYRKMTRRDKNKELKELIDKEKEIKYSFPSAKTNR